MVIWELPCYCLAHQSNGTSHWKDTSIYARDVWEAVRDLYSDLENPSQIFELKIQLWQSKQSDRDVTTYYNELVTLWQELDQCNEDVWENSNDYANRKKREENDRVYMFLTSLNRNFDGVRGAFLAGNLCLPFGKCFLKWDVKKHGGKRCCIAKKMFPIWKLKARPLYPKVSTLTMTVLKSRGASIAKNPGI